MLKPKCILLFLYVGFFHSVFSQDYQIGARSVALSNAVVAVADNWSTFHNQATLAEQKHISAGIFYESRFLLDEFSLKAGTVILPVKKIVSGVSFYQFGQNDFKEYKIGFALAKQLSKQFNLALQLDYFAGRLPENSETFSFITFEVGANYHLNQQITFGAHIFNPVQNGFDFPSEKQKVPATIRFGGNYHFDDFVMVCIEAEKDTENDLLVKSGLEFNPLTNMPIRFGVSGKPFQLSGGLGYRYKTISADIAYTYHQYLGATPSVSVQFDFK